MSLKQPSSLLDHQPLSVIEAQLAGKVVVVSRSGGLPEWVADGVTGMVILSVILRHYVKRLIFC
ncbi:glycosyltransferase [Sporolactobacillus terrae]|nr:glycosyltransferase [Sporolactobacillus terrae]